MKRLTDEGQVAVPPRVTDEAQRWWDSLSDQERIIAALEANHGNEPTYVAEKPWKWLAEAYALRPQAECYVCTHLKEEHFDPYVTEGCQREDCDCPDFEPYPVEVL